MNRRTLTRQLDALGRMLELDGASVFQTRAIRDAAAMLDARAEDPVAAYLDGQLATWPGIGKGLLGDIAHLVRTGRHPVLDELRARWPGDPLRLLDVPGLGPAKVRSLIRELDILDLAGLDQALRQGKVAGLKGFGTRTAEKLMPHVTYMLETSGMALLPDAEALAADMAADLARLEGVRAVHVAGSLARRDDLHARLDLVVITEDGDPNRLPLASLNLVPHEGAWVRHRLGEPTVHVHLATPDTAGAARVFCGANPAHLDRLESRLRQSGLTNTHAGLVRTDGEHVPAPDEEAVYAAMGLPLIPAELREGLDEVDRAAAGTLPRLVTEAEIRGLFHSHTTASDGKAEMADMAREADRRGLAYLAITEHSHAAGYAGGLSTERLAAQHAAVAAWNAGGGKSALLSGIEADILADGTLDMAGDLDACDLVIASIHSRHGEDEAGMTRRVCRALEDPRTTILGHMSGRLLGERAPYAMDRRQVYETAARHGVRIEINGNPQRLDIDWREIRAAKAAGVTFCLSPDAHSTAGLGHARYACDMARKGGLEVGDILNTLDLDDLRTVLDERRARAGGA
ncbi:MAG: PHP domain-containing protein [Candidatus Sericytochromatia bacterium]|nr:PHP domain-containing protein [Candidatus Sericytochromatia bacterium]